MGLPVENYKAYVEADATQRAKSIPADAFFLIHGLADATTPYHHSVQLAKSLTKSGTIFRYTVRFTPFFLFIRSREWEKGDSCCSAWFERENAHERRGKWGENELLFWEKFQVD
jgi:hypothetical protein